MIILIGVLVGLLLGLTGAGGSIFAVPLLMAGLGWSITQAATASLLAVAFAAAVGAGMAWRHSYVRYRAASLMAVVGALFAPIGIRVADGLPAPGLTLIFTLVLAAVAVRMWYSATVSKEDAAVVRAAVAGEGPPSTGMFGKIDAASGRLVWTRPLAVTMATIGAAAGFLSGLLGVGGGFVIVPALRAAVPLSMHSAVATSLMAIAIISMGTFINCLVLGRVMPLGFALPFIAGAVSGMVLGRWLAPFVSGARLQQAFAVMAMIVAFVMAAHAVAWL